MKLLVHALTTAEVLAEIPSGLRAQVLVRIDEDWVTAWATQFAQVSAEFGRADLLEHHQIVSRLHAQLEGCLPARFPTWVADEEALRADLRRRQAELSRALERVRGLCELAITPVWTAPALEETPAEATTPGTRYLLERRRALAGSERRRERARELADEIERLAGADLAAVRRQVCPSPAVALSSALLAPRARAVELMARLPRTQDGVRILVNGPWPPYTFAGTREA
jgi:hypothetical protein